MFLQILNNPKVELDESFKFSREHLLDHVEMLVKIRGIGVRAFQAGKMFSPPVAFVAYPYLVNLL